jgi:hypothetical protein
MHTSENRDQDKTAAPQRALPARGRTADDDLAAALTAGDGLAADPIIPGAALALQRAIGNRAFSALVDGGRPGQDTAGGGEDPFVQRSAVEAVLRSPGQPIDPGVRARVEPKAGVDLSTVRLHTDTEAVRSAALIGARAYTSGRHIVIARRDVNTRVMDHEAIHVGQQSMGPVPGRDNGAGLLMSDPGDDCELEARAGESPDAHHGGSVA